MTRKLMPLRENELASLIMTRERVSAILVTGGVAIDPVAEPRAARKILEFRGQLFVDGAGICAQPFYPCSHNRRGMMDEYETQMAEVAEVDDVIEGLREELNRCPATKRGYREAAEIRDSIMIWKSQREQMLAYAATVAPLPAWPSPPNNGERHEPPRCLWIS